MCREVNVNINKLFKATAEPFSFAYIDKINKTMKKTFIINNICLITKTFSAVQVAEIMLESSLDSSETSQSYQS